MPDRLLPFLAEPSVGAAPSLVKTADGLDMARTRSWIRDGRKIRIRYRDEQARESDRTLWPTAIGYAETVRFLAAWCELRQDFRHFRTDRIVAAEFLDEGHGVAPAALRARWRRAFDANRRLRSVSL